MHFKLGLDSLSTCGLISSLGQFLDLKSKQLQPAKISLPYKWKTEEKDAKLYQKHVSPILTVISENTNKANRKL